MSKITNSKKTTATNITKNIELIGIVGLAASVMAYVAVDIIRSNLASFRDFISIFQFIYLLLAGISLAGFIMTVFAAIKSVDTPKRVAFVVGAIGTFFLTKWLVTIDGVLGATLNSF